MLGHESITTTEIYTHLDRDYLRQSIIKHHPAHEFNALHFFLFLPQTSMNGWNVSDFMKNRKRKFLPFCLLSLYFMVNTVSASEIRSEFDYYGGDTLEFSGYTWAVKESFDKHTGPGRNYFSGSKENVWVDEDGKLHLKLRYKNDRWYCSEVQMLKSLGYGKYVFFIDRLPQPLDKDVVIGLFMYDHTDTSNFHKEIDIEFSKWGKDVDLNTQYVIQPYEEKAFRFDSDLNRPTRHEFSVRKRKSRSIPDTNME